MPDNKIYVSEGTVETPEPQADGRTFEVRFEIPTTRATDGRRLIISRRDLENFVRKAGIALGHGLPTVTGPPTLYNRKLRENGALSGRVL